MLLAVGLMAAGCGSSGSKAALPASSLVPPASLANETATAVAAPSSSTPATGGSVACRGLGQGTTGGDVTWVTDGRLFDRTGCLVERGAEVVAWNGTADRVVLGDGTVLTGDARTQLTGGPLVLSKPTGKAVLRIDGGGKLLKRDVASGEWRDISFLAHHETAVYHPAGRTIASAGTDEAGKASLAIADNVGRNAKPLLGGEAALHVGSLAFTASGALLFTADHGDHVDLHRLEFTAGAKITTITSVKAPSTIADVITSPFGGGGVAWTTGSCSTGTAPVLAAERGSSYLALKGTEAESARPVGWLPDGSLAVVGGQTCQRDKPGKLLVLRTGGATKVDVVAQSVTSAAVRAVLPPPPPSPTILPAAAEA